MSSVLFEFSEMIFREFCQIEKLANIPNTTKKCNFDLQIHDPKSIGAVEISGPEFPVKKFES